MSTVAVVPAYNNESSINALVREVRSYVDCVVVVDDGSTDETSTEAFAAGAQVYRHEVNRGKGAALSSGFRLALTR
jgi:glycosyltransferase involved in cell wall biosynthesis